MRLASISIANFRGFSTRRTIDLDADIVIVWGPNGTGKTSLLDAIQWLVLGEVPRLQATVLRSKEDVVTNRYSEGPVSVELGFRESREEILRLRALNAGLTGHRAADETAGAGATTIVTRTGIGTDERLTVRTPDGVQHEDGQARTLLAELIDRREEDDDAATWFLRTHLLQQAEMTELLSGDTRERYRFLAKLTGLDELSRLDGQLQGELRQLRAALRERERELGEARDRVAVTRSEHEQSLAILASREVEKESDLKRAAAAIAALLQVDSVSSPNELRTVAVRRLAEIQFLVEEASASPEPSDESGALEELRAACAQLVADQEARQVRLLELDGDLVELQQTLRAVESDRTDTKQLAELALAGLGEECPVCGQGHDVERTRARLQDMLQGDNRATTMRARLEALREERATTQAELRGPEAALIAARARVARAEQTARDAGDRASRHAHLEERLRGFVGMPEIGATLRTAVEQRIAELKEAVTELEAKAADAGRRAALRDRAVSAQRDLKARESRLGTLEVDVAALRQRSARAEAVCRWVGQEIVAATGRVIASSNPLAAELYRRLDVHPTFRRFSLKLDRFRESGHLRPWVHDDSAEKDAAAAQLLSAAQFNSLAVCLFLALNLEQQRALRWIVLDDPVQSMDDINVLSLVDVLRTVRRERQVVLTTHDIVLAQLLLRKLRPLNEDQRLLFVKLGSWTRDGPEIDIEDYSGTSRPPFELVTGQSVSGGVGSPHRGALRPQDR